MTNQSTIGVDPIDDRTAEIFEDAIGRGVSIVSSAVTKLEPAPGMLPKPAEAARQHSSTVAAAFKRVSDDVQTTAAASEIASHLSGPLTALLLHMVEIKQHSHQFSPAPGDRVYLQQVIENALQQTERVCAIVKELANNHEAPGAAPGHAEWEIRGSYAKDVPVSGVMVASTAGKRPLTKREREVLNLISEGCSNKQGALRMRISPRTFESHRAKAMRKLGARNTADLVRVAFSHPSAG